MSQLSKTGRPLNRWQLFVKENMAGYKASHPNVPHREVMAALAPMYRQKYGLAPASGARPKSRKGQCRRLSTQAACLKQNDLCQWKGITYKDGTKGKERCIAIRGSYAMSGPFRN